MSSCISGGKSYSELRTIIVYTARRWLSIEETNRETYKSRPSSIFPSDWLVTVCFLRRPGINSVYCSKSNWEHMVWIGSRRAGRRHQTYLHCMPSRRHTPGLLLIDLSCEPSQIWRAAWAPPSDLRGQASNLTRARGNTGTDVKSSLACAEKITYRDTLRRRESMLYRSKWYQGTMLQIMGEAKGFYVFLKAWRNLVLISPETVARKFMSKTGVDILHLAQLWEPTRGSTSIWGIVVLECNTVEEEDNFLGHIGDVTAHLAVLSRNCSETEKGKVRNLDEALSSVIVIVNSHSKRLKLCEKNTAVVAERRHG